MARDIRSKKTGSSRLRGAPATTNAQQNDPASAPPSKSLEAIGALSSKFDQFSSKMDQFFELFQQSMIGRNQTQQYGRTDRNEDDRQQGYGTSERAHIREENRSKDVPTTLRGEPDSRFRENVGSDHRTLAGEPDYRYKENLSDRNSDRNEHETVSGKPDERFGENRVSKDPRPENMHGEAAGPRRGNFSGENVDEQGRHYTRTGEPDHRFAEFRGQSSNQQQQQGRGEYQEDRDRRPYAPRDEREVSRNAREEEPDTHNKGNIQRIHQKRGGKIELNNATLEDLMDIPMMGKGRANIIIQARDRMRGFKGWDDFEVEGAIPGISEGMLANIQEYCMINGLTIEDAVSQERRSNGDRGGNYRASSGSSERPNERAQAQVASDSNIVPLVNELLQNIEAHGDKVSPEDRRAVERVIARISTRPPVSDD